ncbi:MAG: minor capsid protein [Bacteroidales bacterium]|nr:minor capsid protein [Bacteroidales bacterium]
MGISYSTTRKEKEYIKKIVNDNTVKRLTTAKLLDLPYKDIDGDADKRWNMKKVNSALLQSIERGENFDKMAGRLQYVTDMNKVSAMRNARTMTTSFENLGRLDGMKAMQDSGVILKKQWLATHDDKTRDAHAELDGQKAEIDEPFINDLGEIMYPGDPSAYPANVYNCRCTLVYDIEGFEPTLSGGTIKEVK